MFRLLISLLLSSSFISLALANHNPAADAAVKPASHDHNHSTTVRLTSLQWPPYSGAQLRQQGAVVAVARAAFAAMGYQLQVDFFPWSRAVSQARNNNHYQGYFPEYYSDAIAADFYYSASLGTGPLGFAERTNAPHPWQQLDDLAPLRIGVVQDYVNTAEFDQRAAQGKLQTEAVLNDRSNLLKLINGRIDLAVIDQHVMNYLFATESGLKGKDSEVHFNPHLLAQKELFICFNKDAEGKRMLEIFNQGLSRINHQAILKRYLQQSPQP